MAKADEIEVLARAVKKMARDIEDLRDRGADLWSKLQELKAKSEKSEPEPKGGDDAEEEDDFNPFKS